MNSHDLAARGERADRCYNEFVGPALRDMRKVYAERLVEVAVQEIHPQVRADKLTSLATAIKILDNIESAIRALIEDGKIAHNTTLRVDEIDRMTAPSRRLREFAPN